MSEDMRRVEAGSALLGVASLAELTPAHLAAAPVVSEPGVLSAFPLL